MDTAAIRTAAQMKHRSFAAIILTHGKPTNVATYRSLRAAGYTGRIVLLVDDEDKTLKDYQASFPGEVEVFSKAAVRGTFDMGDNFPENKCVVLARNACFPLAKRLGLKYFIELDDDYNSFRYMSDAEDQFTHLPIRSLNGVLDSLIAYLDRTGAKAVAMAQGGDFMGGEKGTRSRQLYPWRKCMNTFVCRTDRPFTFAGRLNEDVSTYVMQGIRGGLMLTIPTVAINQAPTQTVGNGMTEAYQKFGTYVKSFHSVMRAPSCVKIIEIGGAGSKRLHHLVQWPLCTPAILDESLRKHSVKPKRKASKKS